MGVENFGFIHALVASFSVILVSEIGDKTFFIAAIMAMRHPRMTVFAGAITALALMTILSGKRSHVVYLNKTRYEVPTRSLNYL
jgi:putative Ca2+/H+ antiporter (TMEM165/GDT1 family)